MAVQIQIRRDTADNWVEHDPILAQGEFGYEIDTDKIKIGDGIVTWNNLPYHVGDVKSVSGKTGHVILDKQDVGLGNVDNTSDSAKPISTDTQTALNTKVDKVAGKGLSTEDYTTTEKNKLSGIATGATANSSDATLLARANHTGTQSADTITDGTTNKAFTATEKTKLSGVATGATANDTDANLKNRANHTGTQTASTISDFNTAADARVSSGISTHVAASDPHTQYQKESEKGSANGYAELDATGKIPSGQLPSFVDDVVEAANYAALPVTGEAGKIYVTLDDNKTYRWSGSAYVEISSSLALGETSTTAYRGDRGKTAYDHTLNTNNPHGVTKAQVGLSNVDNTSDVNKPISSATQTALDGKVDENASITGATKTKITYDTKGLVTAGADATTADIADSTDKRYVTDANLTVIGNTSGTNTGDNATNSQYSGLDAAKVNKAGDTMSGNLNMGTNSLIGGTGVTDILKLQATTGNGTAGNAAIQALVGNNGATAALTVLNDGNVGIGATTPEQKLTVNGDAYIYNTATLGSNLVDTWTNNATLPVETFTLGTPTSDVAVANNSSGIGIFYKAITIKQGVRYKVDFTTTVNSGSLNAFRFLSGLSNDGATLQLDKTIVAGANSFEYVSTRSGTEYLLFGSTNAFDVSITNFSFKEVTGGNLNVAGLITGGGATGLKVDNIGNVGIGVTAPGAKLQVDSTVTTTVGAIIKGAAAQTADLLQLQDSAAAKLVVVDSAGNVGIGTTTPNYLLDVKGVIGFTANSGYPYYTEFATPTNFGYDAGYRAVMLGSASTVQDEGNRAVTLSIGYNPSINANGSFAGNGGETIFRNGMRFITPNATNDNWNLNNLILKDGNVGIGTAAPTSKLHITSEVAATVGQIIRGAAAQTADLLQIQDSSANKLMVVSSAGNVGIGTTSPGVQLQVGTGTPIDADSLIHAIGTRAVLTTQSTTNGNNAGFRLYTKDANGIAKGGGLYYYPSTTAGMSSFSISCDDVNHHLNVLANGNVGIGTTTPSSTLDLHGSLELNIVNKTADYTAASETIINCTANTFTVTLPTAVGIDGRYYTIKNSGTGVITVATTSSQTIDGAATKSLPTQYDKVTVVSDGANWIIIG